MEGDQVIIHIRIGVEWSVPYKDSWSHLSSTHRYITSVSSYLSVNSIHVAVWNSSGTTAHTWFDCRSKLSKKLES